MKSHFPVENDTWREHLTHMDQPKNLLTEECSQQRYEAERLQGEKIISGIEGDAWGWSGAAGTIRAERRADFLIQAAGLKPGVRCLEVGCGTGEFTERLLRANCDLYAVELSEITAKRCQERVGNRARVIVGNLETGEGLSDYTFDAIVGVSVLHHLNLPLFFKATLSRLKPGGRFAFSEPNMANPQIWAERNIGFVRKWRHVTPHETAFRTRPLRKMFEAEGLVVDVCEPFEFLHPATPKFAVPLLKGIERMVEATPLRAIAGSIRFAGHKPA